MEILLNGSGGTAGFDRSHDAQLRGADMPGVGRTPCRPVAAEDVGHLQVWPGHGGSGRQWTCQSQMLERALDLSDRVEGHPRIPRGRGDMAMTEQILDYANVDTAFQQMSG